MNPITPTRCADPFDDPAFLFEIKLDGFSGLWQTRLLVGSFPKTATH
jgi:hypothetical protein